MTITLKTLHQATAQEVFDQVKNHLLSQMKQSEKQIESGSTVCAYRNPDGLKCAAGYLVSDSEYDSLSASEGQSWLELVGMNVVPSAHCYLIIDLQDIHDDYPADEWEEKLKALALERNLKWN